jgi:intracellular septation protein A
MKNFLHSGRVLLLDMASTVCFLILYSATHSLALSVVLGIALGVAQMGWELARRKPIDALQWVSLVAVVASGTATLVTDDPRFVMIKLSVIYAIVGVVMCKRGWMERYLPPEALTYVPDLGIAFGYIWAGMMFFTAIVNGVVAMSVSFGAWAAFMSVFGMGTKLGLFLIQFTIMKVIGHRRGRAQAVAAGAAGAAA